MAVPKINFSYRKQPSFLMKVDNLWLHSFSHSSFIQVTMKELLDNLKGLPSPIGSKPLISIPPFIPKEDKNLIGYLADISGGDKKEKIEWLSMTKTLYIKVETK